MIACFSCWLCYDNCGDTKGDWESVDGETDREMDCTVLIIVCRSFATVPDNTARDSSIPIDEGNVWQ